MTWFAELFGFPESAKSIGRYLAVDGTTMHSSANGRTFTHGTLVVPTLDRLRNQAAVSAASIPGTPTVREVVADAAALHADPANQGALFQVASQFNLLEMVSPSVTPDRGITRYEGDPTQGPVCAMACAAGTLHRNWIAQSTKEQIDTIAAVGDALGNTSDGRSWRRQRGRFWDMRNGYALLTGEIPPDCPTTHPELAIGLQLDTEVTAARTGRGLEQPGHRVHQAYCSALPITYSSVDADDVEPLARMVLNSTYEATLAAATVYAAEPGHGARVFLTLVGGGVFGNPVSWITDAVERAVDLYANTALDIRIVSYGHSNPALTGLLR